VKFDYKEVCNVPFCEGLLQHVAMSEFHDADSGPDDPWRHIAGTFHDGDDLPGSGNWTTLEEAKEHADSMPECMGFTLERTRGIPVVWYHSWIERGDCCNAGCSQHDLYVHLPRFSATHGHWEETTRECAQEHIGPKLDGSCTKYSLVSSMRYALTLQCVLIGLIVITIAWLHVRIPDEISFHGLVTNRYGVQASESHEGGLAKVDQSHAATPTSVTWSSLGVAALGRTHTKHGGRAYEHTYLGLAGRWIMLPYLPRVHLKNPSGAFRYGMGLCLKGSCICVPDHKAPCKQLHLDTSSLLSVVLGLNMALFLAGLCIAPHEIQTSWLGHRCSVSWPTLRKGQLAPLLFGPFFHTGLFEFARSVSILINVLEPCGEHGGTLLFFGLYLGGSIVHFLGMCTAFKAQGAQWRVNEEVYSGCRGGLTSLLVLLSWVSPRELFNFSFYLFQAPMLLSPMGFLVANAIVDAIFGISHGRCVPELVGHFLAMCWGYALASVSGIGF